VELASTIHNRRRLVTAPTAYLAASLSRQSVVAVVPPCHLLRAAMMALSIGTIGSAYANDNRDQVGGYAYPDYVFPGSISGGVQAPVQTQQSSQAIHTFVTRSANQGTWLFAPAQGGNG
jgi:hypothetical protein